jgi:pimeloyl-ACP methyl ester carboxylesterase
LHDIRPAVKWIVLNKCLKLKGKGMVHTPNTDSRTTFFHYLDFNPQGHPAVVLLHGLGVDGSSWGYQIPSLCEAGLRPIAPDLPGFGKSIAGKGRWSIGKVAEDLERFVLGLVGQPLVVVGISMGGTIALQFALDFPQWVEKLVLVNTFACLRPQRFDEMGYLLGRFVVANVRGKEYQAEMVTRRIFPREEQRELRRAMTARILQADQRIYRQAMQALALFDVRRRLAEIHVPTLVISGQNDNTVPLVNQRVLAEHIPGARQVIIPDAGHAVIVDQVAAFNRTLLEFICANQYN